ncbi:hypothetical protein ACLB1O_28070 [Escherichia coli]
MQSLHMGNTPDTPSASGTVNRVVQGVIIPSVAGIRGSHYEHYLH